MSNSNKHSRNRRRYHPAVADTGEGANLLERRLLLNGGKATVAGHGHAPAHHRPEPAPAPHHVKVTHRAKRLTPAQEINAQYAAFLTAFRTVENSYVASLNEQSTNTVNVSTTVAAPYAAGSPTIQVADASVFGTEGTFSTPVAATATVGSVTIGQFSLIGSSANQVIVNLAASSSIPMNVGTVLSATVPVNAQSSAAAIFPSFIQSSTQQLAVKLDRYFNNLPIPLPNKVTSSHQAQQPGAIQQYVYQQVTGSGPSSLQQVLKAIILPTTPGADLQIYDASVAIAVNASRLQLLNGVKQIFAGVWQVQPPTPSSSSTTSGTSSTTTSGSGSTAG